MYYDYNNSRESSEAVWKSRWPSWVPCVPDKPDGFCGRKAALKQLQLRWWYCLEPAHTGDDRLVSFQARWWSYLCNGSFLVCKQCLSFRSDRKDHIPVTLITIKANKSYPPPVVPPSPPKFNPVAIFNFVWKVKVARILILVTSLSVLVNDSNFKFNFC